MNINWCFPGFLKPSQEKVASGKLTWQWKSPMNCVGNTSSTLVHFPVSYVSWSRSVPKFGSFGTSRFCHSFQRSSSLSHLRTSAKWFNLNGSSTGFYCHVENDCPFIHGLIKGNLMVNKPLIRPAISGGGYVRRGWLTSHDSWWAKKTRMIVTC